MQTFDELSREELLALVRQQHAELQQLRTQVQTPLPDMAEAGSIAEAALQLTGVLQATQRAADIYLHSVETIKAKQESEYSLRLAEAEQQAQALLLETQQHCRASVTRAEESAAFYWAELQKQLEAFFAGNPGLVQALLRRSPPPADECFGPDD